MQISHRRPRAAFVRAVGALLAVAGCLLVPSGAAGADQPGTAKIINGSIAPTGADAGKPLAGTRWESIAALVDASASDAFQGQFCGASVISSTLVLTAAHCVYDDNGSVLAPTAIDVVTLRHTLSDNATGERLDVKRVVPHARYGPTTFQNDLALLELAAPTAAAPIALVRPGQEALWGGGAGKQANATAGPWIAGWGNRDTDCDPPFDPCDYPDELHQATIALASDKVCGNDELGGSTSAFVPRLMLCGGVLDTDGNEDPNASNGRDTCQGDSGGPLIVSNGAGGWLLVGVTSWGYRCGADTYGFYSRLVTLRTWVECQRSLGVGGPGGPAGLQPPVNASVSNIRAGTALLTFSGPLSGSSPGQYNLYAVRDGVEKFHGVAYGTPYTIRKLQPNTRYQFVLRSAVDGCSESGPGSVFGFRTAKDTVRPSRPGAPRAAARSRTSITLRWKAARDEFGIRRYLVQERKGASWKTIKRVGPHKLKLRVGKLQRGSTHTFRIVAVDPSGNTSRPTPARRYSTRG